MFERLSTNEVAHRLYRDKNANWSWEGAKAIAEWLEEDEEETELDVVAIRCEFSEYESAEKAAEEYGWHDPDWGTNCVSSDNDDTALKWLQDRTTVIEFDGGVIVQEF